MPFQIAAGDFVRVIREPIIDTPWLRNGTVHEVEDVEIWDGFTPYLKLRGRPSVWNANRFVLEPNPTLSKRESRLQHLLICRVLVPLFSVRGRRPKSWRHW